MRLHHPLHPAIAHFPVALWLSAAAADATYLLTGDAAWAGFSRLALLGGTAMGGLAVLAGLLELVLRRIPREAVMVVATHVGFMFVALTCCGASAALRHEGAISHEALILSFIGAASVAAGGWFGGTLVYRFGIGGAASRKDA